MSGSAEQPAVTGPAAPLPDGTPALIRALQRPQAFPHPLRYWRLLQTHISWVILTGDYCYKIKKPVRFSFLDFSTLERRHQACLEELRLNRRFAPQLYLGVVPIAGEPAQAAIDGAGEVLEYAVRMREFPQSAQLDRMLEAGELHGEDLEALGRRLAALHQSAPAAADTQAYGRPQQVHAPVHENFNELLAGCRDAALESRLAALSRWSEQRYAQLETALQERKAAGRIREGHGDLHLANLVKFQGEVLPFDCIEFDPALRWIDVIDDAAFLVMDLQYRGRSDLAYRFLNAYLEAGGDYAGVRVLSYYVVYRALVRAKVAMLSGEAAGAGERSRQRRALAAYVGFAAERAQAAQPLLVLTHGLSGSGKTRLSAGLAAHLPAIRIRSDIERKRLHGLAAASRTASAVAGGLYDAAASERTYRRLAELAEAVLAGGETAIVDAACLAHEQRARFAALARRLEVPLAIVDCQAPEAELRRRIDQRAARCTDASEADRKVLDHQLAHAEPLDPAERARAVTVDTTAEVDLAALAAKLRQQSGPVM